MLVSKGRRVDNESVVCIYTMDCYAAEILQFAAISLELDDIDEISAIYCNLVGNGWYIKWSQSEEGQTLDVLIHLWQIE